MAFQRFTLEVETMPTSGGDAAALPAFVLVTPGAERNQIEPNGNAQVNVIVKEDGLFTTGGAGDPTPLGQWRLGPGWKVRVSLLSDGAGSMSIADVSNWAAPELRIGQPDDEGGVAWRSESLTQTMGEEQTVGRSRNRANIVVNDDLVSAVHLSIRCETDGYWAEDLKTPNGTIMDGNPLIGRAKLRHGSRLRIGNTTLEFCHVLQLLREGAARPVELQASIVELRQSQAMPVANPPNAQKAAALPSKDVVPPTTPPAPPKSDSKSADGRSWMILIILVVLLALLVGFVAMLIHQRDQQNHKPARASVKAAFFR